MSVPPSGPPGPTTSQKSGRRTAARLARQPVSTRGATSAVSSGSGGSGGTAAADTGTTLRITAGDPATGARPLSDPELLSPRLRRRRALALVVLTLIAPGSAQYVAGNRPGGRLALRIWLSTLLVLAALGLLALLRRSWLLSLVSSGWFLTLLAVFLVVGAAGWALLFLDAARLGRLRGAPPKTRAGVAGLTAVLMLLTAGPMLLASGNVLAGRDAISAVFGGNISRPPSDGRYNVLLLGGDSGASRAGTRPDTIMLASVNADNGRSVMFGFARETENIKFRPGSTMATLMPEGWDCGDQCLLNGLYTWAMEHRDRFPPGTKDPGALATKEAVEALSGLDVHYYVLVDLRGFQRLVDALGGIDVVVKKRTPIGGGTNERGGKNPITGWIEPGDQHLDGYHALWYARSREGSSNPERMARQRCVLTAILHQVSPQNAIVNFQKVAAVSGSVVQTDLPASDLGGFADLALQARSGRIKSVNFVPPLIKPWDYDPQVVKDTVRTTIEASESDESAPVRRTPAPARTTSGTGTKKPAPKATGGTAGPQQPDDPTAGDLSDVCTAG